MSEVGTTKPPRLPKSAPRVRLSVVAGPGAGQTIELTRCVSIIGSRPGCKLLLKSQQVSPTHCAIINTGEEAYIRDLVSENGTFLNDLPVRLERLEDDARIRIGQWELRVEILAYNVDTLSDLPHVYLEPEPSAFGVEVNGSGSLVKLSKPIGLVGRKEGCDVVIGDKLVSRAHVLLFTYLSQPVFCDVLSNNGVIVEGGRQAFGLLHSGDYLYLGPKRIRVVLPGLGRRSDADERAKKVFAEPGRSGSGSGAVDALEGSADGTVVSLSDDEGDRIDIRMAEVRQPKRA